MQLADYVHAYATHPLALAALAALLMLYQVIARRSRALPQIPLGLIILFLVLEIVDITLEPYDIGAWRKYIDITTTIVLYMVVVRFIVAVVFELWLGRLRKKPLPNITRDFVLAVAFAVIVLWTLRTVGGINLTSLLTTSAILTAVVGLALQDTLGSFFAGLSLQIERPYVIGDWITCKNYEGKVTGISWRTTRIRTRFNEVVYIPNNAITKEVIKNYSQPDPTYVVKLEVGVEYGTPPNKVRQVIMDVLKTHPRVVQPFNSTVRIMEFGDFSIKYVVWTKVDDLENWYRIVAELRSKIWYAFRRAGIRIPFPIRDVNMRYIDDERIRQDRLRGIETSLRGIPILESLSDEDLATLATGVRVEEYGIGDEVVTQGDAGDSMFLIESGACDVVMEKPGVYAQRVATLGAGSFFGEMSLLTGEPRTATVIAKEDATLIAVDRGAFRDMLIKHPGISEDLARALADRQAQLDQIKKEQSTVDSTAKTLLQRIKSIFGLR